MKNKIVLVPFPFDNLSSSKVRPAVCLSNAVGAYDHIVLAFITSQIPDTIEASDILIEQGNKNFGQTGLRVTSVLRVHRMMTVSRSIIQRELGILPDELQKEVEFRLRDLFGL